MKLLTQTTLTQTTKIILIISLLSGCAAIPGRNIKLESYPQITIDDVKNLDVSYKYGGAYGNLKSYQEFDLQLSNKFESKPYRLSYFKKSEPTSCIIEVSTSARVPLVELAVANYLVSFVTLFIVPSYTQHIFEAKANLISYPSESSILGKNINIIEGQVNLNQAQIKQSKTKDKGIIKTTNYLLTQSGQRVNEGDYFFDENKRLTRLLKTYYLKDKAHEVWSLIWMLNPLSWDEPAPETGKRITENTISEALVRSILNDASKFEECKKDQPLTHRNELQNKDQPKLDNQDQPSSPSSSPKNK